MFLSKIPQDLIEEIQRKNCVLFVGAGLSRGAGLPDWETLLLDLIELGDVEYGITFADKPALVDLITGKDKKYLTAADAIENKLSPTILSLALTKIFRNDNVIPNDTYRLLPTIPFAAVITTNYDKLLETTYASVLPTHPIIVNNSNKSNLISTLKRNVFYILKAHGDIDEPDSIVLGNKSYRKLLHDNVPYTRHLETVFRTKTVLFVGFSMNDPDLELLLNRESAITDGFGNVRYALMDETSLNPHRDEELFKTYSINTILYKPATPTHQEVKEFLIQLSQRTGTKAETSDRSSPRQETAVPADAPNLAEAIAERPTAKGEIISGASQIIELLDLLRKSLDKKGGFEIDNFNAARLQLLAKTLLAKYIPDNLLDNHEANNLYLFRDEILPQSLELIELLRAIINDYGSDYVPGWSWLKHLEDSIDFLISKAAIFDPSSSVRENAFNMLKLAQVTPQESFHENFARTITKDPSPAVRRSCLTYLGRVGSQEQLGLVASGLVDEDQSVSGEANLSKYLILSRVQPGRAFSDMLRETNLKFDIVLDELKNKKEKIKIDFLLAALDHSSNEVRFFAVEELLKRNQLNKETAVKLKDDKYDPIQVLAYRFLVENNRESLEPTDICLVPEDFYRKYWSRDLHTVREPSINRQEIVHKYYEKYNYEQLVQMLRWSEYYGADVYWTLACDHFEEFGQQLREDLRSDFTLPAEEYFKCEVVRYEELNKPASQVSFNVFGLKRHKESTPEEDAARSVESEKEKYIRAALAGLVKNGSPEDVEFGRRFLFHKNKDVGNEAVQIIQKWGDESDFSGLIKIAKSSDAALQEAAAKAALRISGTNLRVAEQLISSENEILVSIAVAHLISLSDKQTVGEFLKEKGYLNKNAAVRIRVLAFFIFQNENENLYNLLSNYTSAGSYFYDIVCYLDRILYAPINFQLAYRQALRDKFYGLLTFEDSYLKVIEEKFKREKIFDDLIPAASLNDE